MTGAVPPTEWTPLGEPGTHYWFVQRMAKASGVDMAMAADSGSIDQDHWAEIVHTCRSCQWTDGCERWLSRQDHDTMEGPPDECLNAGILRELAERQGE